MRMIYSGIYCRENYLSNKIRFADNTFSSPRAQKREALLRLEKAIRS